LKFSISLTVFVENISAGLLYTDFQLCLAD